MVVAKILASLFDPPGPSLGQGFGQAILAPLDQDLTKCEGAGCTEPLTKCEGAVLAVFSGDLCRNFVAGWPASWLATQCIKSNKILFLPLNSILI